MTLNAMSHLNENCANLTAVTVATGALLANADANADTDVDEITMNLLTSTIVTPKTISTNDATSSSSSSPLLTSLTPPPPTTTVTTTGLPPTKVRPTTPTPAKKFASKRPPNLMLKIYKSSSSSKENVTENANETANTTKYAETENVTLSGGSSSNSSSGNITGGAQRTSNSNCDNSSTSSATASIFPHEQYKIIKKLDIGFQNITYNTKTGFFRRENKTILHGLTGEFRNGELSAIVGPSGAGKSTFLNILSAYTPYGYTGEVTVNGNPRDIKAFKPNVAFIMQDTSLQPFLTVKEAMHFAANLKIGKYMTKNEKRERVRKILEAIGMYENRHTRTGNLSGGQKKRLAIALELVNNPPVLILDEPTSGLDSSTSNQCISLLKKLAMEGRTVICTIHQPSALTFEMFDHLYAIAEGKCIYSGATGNLVPFLAEAGLHCPESYNPADYLMEIATDDYGKQNHKLVEKIDNGQNDSYRQDKHARKAQFDAIAKIDKMMAIGLITPVKAPILTPQQCDDAFDQRKHNAHFHQYKKQLTPINEMSSRVWDSRGVLNESDATTTKEITDKKKKPKLQMDPAKLCKRENIYATPFYMQLGILLVRTFLILWRDKSLTTMRFVIHFVTALLIGFLYYGIGNDAANALNNFRYVFYTIMFIMYCAFSAILVKFPLEFPIVLREHFNRWYSLRAYYTAITLADIPIQIICTTLFIVTTYVLTAQPFELVRILLFSFIVFLTALVGQSIGLTVGASLSVQLGAIFGPFFICPFLAFSGFFLQEKDGPFYLRWIFKSSFLKYSLDGSMLALFGYDRPKLECNQMYCHFSRPQIFLKSLDMEHASYETATIFLLSSFLILRIISFYIMSFRLRLFR